MQDMGVDPKGYLLATVHRPYNTDIPEYLRGILNAFLEIGEPLIFPCIRAHGKRSPTWMIAYRNSHLPAYAS